jgi:hypothetical protein
MIRKEINWFPSLSPRRWVRQAGPNIEALMIRRKGEEGSAGTARLQAASRARFRRCFFWEETL